MEFFKKLVSNYIDRIGKRIQKNDPTLKRLKEKEKELQGDIEQQLIERFGSLDNVPKSFKKFYNINE